MGDVCLCGKSGHFYQIVVGVKDNSFWCLILQSRWSLIERHREAWIF